MVVRSCACLACARPQLSFNLQDCKTKQNSTHKGTPRERNQRIQSRLGQWRQKLWLPLTGHAVSVDPFPESAAVSAVTGHLATALCVGVITAVN